MAPQLGQVVLYIPTQDQKNQMAANSDICNQVDKLPAIITHVWSETCVNLKVIHDGDIADIWETSSSKGDNERDWDFMPDPKE